MAVLGTLALLAGTWLLVRGTIFLRSPHGPTAERRKRRNLQRGLTTDMAVFGRKVQRLGMVGLLVGVILWGWKLSYTADAARGFAPPPTTPAR
jgi:hypothetical protein